MGGGQLHDRHDAVDAADAVAAQPLRAAPHLPGVAAAAGRGRTVRRVLADLRRDDRHARGRRRRRRHHAAAAQYPDPARVRGARAGQGHQHVRLRRGAGAGAGAQPGRFPGRGVRLALDLLRGGAADAARRVHGAARHGGGFDHDGRARAAGLARPGAGRRGHREPAQRRGRNARKRGRGHGAGRLRRGDAGGVRAVAAARAASADEHAAV
ncbi:hypothetical protein D9M72_473850 [compost metagenome]